MVDFIGVDKLQVEFEGQDYSTFHDVVRKYAWKEECTHIKYFQGKSSIEKYWVEFKYIFNVPTKHTYTKQFYNEQNNGKSFRKIVLAFSYHN
jgi:hypothetical protein